MDGNRVSMLSSWLDYYNSLASLLASVQTHWRWSSCLHSSSSASSRYDLRPRSRQAPAGKPCHVSSASNTHICSETNKHLLTATDSTSNSIINSQALAVYKHAGTMDANTNNDFAVPTSRHSCWCAKWYKPPQQTSATQCRQSVPLYENVHEKYSCITSQINSQIALNALSMYTQSSTASNHVTTSNLTTFW